MRNILAWLALPLLAFLVLGLVDARTYSLDLSVAASRPASLDLAVNPGELTGQDPPAATVLASARPQTVRFQFSACNLQQLVLHANAGAGIAAGAGEVHCAVDELLGFEHVYARFQPADLQAPAGAARPAPRRDGLSALVNIPGTTEAALSVSWNPPAMLGFDWGGYALAASLALAEYVFLAAGTLLAWRRLRNWEPVRRRIDVLPAAGNSVWRNSVEAARSHPSAAIWVVAEC